MVLREIENELFEINIRNDITVAPMREYIEEWLRKQLVKIINPDLQEMVVEIMPPQQQQTSTKEAPPRK
jgi:hypothetical protein